MKKPRGTRDLYGGELKEFNWVRESIERIFTRYGYSEVRTPIFESVEVFAPNDEGFLSANKEFFHLQNKRDPSKEPEFVLRPENTASVVRMVWEEKMISEKNLSTLSFFYCGPCFRYERPQSGRFRQFTQAGVEKINAKSPDSDVENILMMKEILDFFGLENVKLKCNYLGGTETKRRWKEDLTVFFRQYEDQLTEDSRRRIEVNPFRILDDKVDGSLDFISSAPRILDHLTEEERKTRETLESKLSIALGDPSFTISNDIFRGIDYYDGLVFEWIYFGRVEKGEPLELTVAAGGRYDGLYGRFDGRVTYPSLGFAIGLERLCMILKLEGKIPPDNIAEVYVCFGDMDSLEFPPTKVRTHLFPKEILENPNLSCFVSYENMNFEKHVSTAIRMGKRFFCFLGSSGKCTMKDLSLNKNFETRTQWLEAISSKMSNNRENAI